jgi:hypothetical protein
LSSFFHHRSPSRFLFFIIALHLAFFLPYSLPRLFILTSFHWLIKQVSHSRSI